jgi:hypothetical protein
MSKGISYTPKDIENFSKSLAYCHAQHGHCTRLGHANMFDEKVGVFLSALMNAGKSKRFRIFAMGLPFKIRCLGAENTKIITVFGDLGENTGIRMHSGRLTVHGSVGGNVGSNASGGDIRINGNIRNLPWGSSFDDSNRKVNIFQYDRQLVKDGKIIGLPNM